MTTIALNSFRPRSANVDVIINTPYKDPSKPKHESGPDYTFPTDKTMTWDVTGAVKIRTLANAPKKEESVYTFVKRTVDKYPKQIALATKKDGKWVKWTYKDYWRDICIAAKGFMKLGLLPFHGVGILGFNAPEWFITHFAAMFAGGLSAGIYTTNSSDAVYHVLKDCAANIVVVENETQLKKVLAVRSKLPDLKAIIQYSGQTKDQDVYSWSDLMTIGQSLPDAFLNSRIKGLAVNQCCCLIYTSGTTGNPKGVMLNHDNLHYFVYYLVTKLWPMETAKEIFVSYLPLSHIAALQADIYAPIMLAGTVYFATPDALKGKLVDLLAEVRPTVVLGVPRVWEKFTEKIKEAQDSMSQRRRSLFVWSQKQSLAYHLNRINTGNTQKPCGYKIASKVVFSKLKKRLGIDRAKCLLSGGAPLAKEVLNYFLSLDIVIYESYGLSETTGPFFANVKTDYQIGSVGKLSEFVEGKIDRPDASGNGEILLRGRPVFMGYLNMEQNTKEALTNDGWLHTGDVGYLEKDFLFITGRIKEIIITSGGENVAPVPIEDSIKELLPVISNCMLLGDKRKFLALLVTLKTDVNLDTLMPTDQLTPAALKWCKERGCNHKTVSEILKAGPDPAVLKGIQEGIDKYNNTFAVSNAQRVQKFVILPQDFSVPGDELGPTLKLKRPVVSRKFNDYIEGLYKGAD